MAYDNRGTNLPGVVAAADLSALQHRFVTIGASGVNTTAAAGRIDAVLDNDPILNQAATLMGPGSVAKVEASAAIAVGAKVGSAAAGKARTAVAGDHVIGICVEAAGADGELCSVWLFASAGSENIASAVYAPTNVTPDRAYDADTVVITELADVVGTLIADLQAAGILG